METMEIMETLVLNFSHPLNLEELAQFAIPEATEQRVFVQIDQAKPIGPQIREIVDSIGLTPEEWQTDSIIINPPGLAVATAVLLAELHGRMGYFPPVIRVAPVPGVTPPRFHIAEIVYLQEVRSQARARARR